MLLLLKHLEDHKTILLQVSTPSLAIGLVLHMALATWILQEHRENLETTTQERYKVQDDNHSGMADHSPLLQQYPNTENYQHSNYDRLERSLRLDNLDHRYHWPGNAAL